MPFSPLIKQALLLLFTLVTLCSCASNPNRTSGSVTHIVLCSLKNPNDTSALARLTAASHAFKGQIPGLLEVTTGTPVISHRPEVKSDYDFAAVFVFQSLESLRNYEQHPLHTAAVRNTLQPLVKDIKIYDIVSQLPTTPLRKL